MKLDNSKIAFSKADLCKNLILPEVIDEDLAEEIGLHVGDGSMNFYKIKDKIKGIYQLRGHLKDDKEHYYKRIKSLYKDLYNINISLRDMPSTGVIGFQLWSDALIQFKHEVLGLSLGKKTNITIPKEIIENNELSKTFLRGFMIQMGACIFIKDMENHIQE